ncbi:MAG: zinc metallopeptidase [Puniceicoccales bacterium]|jgi:Zn-dependent membrane protease YugP|nr:zinc metallopeptidase [Puniceicoccales bacterium]
MKPLIVLVAALVAAAALPLLAALSLKQAWRRGKVPASCGRSGAFFALFLLRKVGVENVHVVEGGRLFCERYKSGERDIVLSSEVYSGKSISALAHAALQAGHALRHRDNALPAVRLAWWSGVLRLLVNAAPVLFGLLFFVPGGVMKFIPLLAAFGLLLAAAQVLTYPAVRAAAERATGVVFEKELLQPEEMPAFRDALRAASKRHLAAPVLDCLWLRWLW